MFGHSIEEDTAVSPVIAVILMVAVTVVLSAAIGTFVLDIGQQSTDEETDSLGVQVSETNSGVEVTVITGTSDTLRVLVEGNEKATLTNPEAGDSTTVSALKGDKLTVVAVKGSSQSVVTTTIIGSTSFGPELISNWPLDDSSDTTTAIDSVSGYNGYINQSEYVSSNRGTAMYFDGSGDFVNVTTNEDLNLTSPFTLSLWVKHNASHSYGNSASKYVAGKGHNWKNSPYSLRFYPDSSEFGFVVSDGSNYYTTTPVVTGWAHLVGVYNGTHINLYLNGEQKDTASVGGTILKTDDEFRIGAAEQDYPRYYNGIIEDVRLYNQSLTPAEVKHLYTSTK